jgi:hypothetical protein
MLPVYYFNFDIDCWQLPVGLMRGPRSCYSNNNTTSKAKQSQTYLFFKKIKTTEQMPIVPI